MIKNTEDHVRQRTTNHSRMVTTSKLFLGMLAENMKSCLKRKSTVNDKESDPRSASSGMED